MTTSSLIQLAALSRVGIFIPIILASLDPIMTILKAKGLDYTVGASYIARMTTPAAAAALDELVAKAWTWMAEDAFVMARQFHEAYLSMRALPVQYAILHKLERQPNRYGLVRTFSEDLQKVPIEPGLRIYTRLGGMVSEKWRYHIRH